MYSEQCFALGSKRSAIRELFEYGKLRSAEVGRENVYDFSLGNPTVPSPDCVKEAIVELLNTESSIDVHGYTSAQGDGELRKKLAEYYNEKYGTQFHMDNFYITCGAAASLTITFRALTESKLDEFIAIAPYFPEYKGFVEGAGATFKVVSPDTEHFQINMEALSDVITSNTKGIIINSPNNPSGTVYSEKTIMQLATLLKEKEEQYGHPIFLISDEPYREIVYDDIEVPYVTKYYANTIVCYSYSKSLSLPGERIGFILVPDEVVESKNLYYAICGAGRIMGYVCAPSLFQKVVKACIGQTGDMNAYKENRDVLYDGLTKLGFECIRPQGAFYMFIKTMGESSVAFCEKAKEFDLLIVAADGFGCPGYARISYCVDKDMIVRSMRAFEQLAACYANE